MKEERYAELLDASIERLEALGIDSSVATNASRDINTHQSKLLDGMVEYLDRDLGVRHGNCRAGPNPARVLALRLRHFLVPQNCSVAAFLRRQVGKVDGKGPE